MSSAVTKTAGRVADGEQEIEETGFAVGQPSQTSILPSWLTRCHLATFVVLELLALSLVYLAYAPRADDDSGTALVPTPAHENQTMSPCAGTVRQSGPVKRKTSEDSDAALVKEWLLTLKEPGRQFVKFQVAGGFGSQRNEVMNALAIANAFGQTLFVDDSMFNFVIFRSVYNLTRLRAQLLRSPATKPFAFAFYSELIEHHIDCVGPDEGATNPFTSRYRIDQTFSSISSIIHYMVAEKEGNRWWDPHAKNTNCLFLPRLDGASFWTQDLTQCQMNSSCVSIFRAFTFTNIINDMAARARSEMKKFLVYGDKYTCFHMNTIDGEPLSFINWAFKKNETKTFRNILIVGQRDNETVPLLKTYLRGAWGWKKVSVFSATQLGVGSLAESARDKWLRPAYQRRGAVSQALCKPGFASSYLGEWWSSFTHGILTTALVDGPFKDGWYMQIFGPEDKFPHYQTNWNYHRQVRAMNVTPPHWIQRIYTYGEPHALLKDRPEPLTPPAEPPQW
eukprot:gnl/TRDRNA2_/TRDRNA2_168448_c0_seq1.p1 gnl/TRDRNA2_/TRDRNA2_168448_c0~~gnl/TRDRNA2_/TRDRNA2_168448_c0_seq1.p1  ORF type:complete len:507 (+),score=46.35 gnl/TRDRNA2_/TRDRNA2_168448_c0_seq1:117-1637(+)